MRFLPKSKTHRWLIVIFIVASAFVWFGKLGGSEWVTLIFGELMTMVGRDSIKDDDSALKAFIKRKKDETKNMSDDDLASAIDKQLDARK